MGISDRTYGKMVEKASPNSKILKDFVFSYLIGGLICVIGQLFYELYLYLGLNEKIVDAITPCTLIFFAALLTGLKVFEKIAKFAGAGTLVPITGFANAVVSPAIEFKNEGQVLGIGAKIFTIAGPVILFGTVASIIYGIFYYIYTLVM